MSDMQDEIVVQADSDAPPSPDSTHAGRKGARTAKRPRNDPSKGQNSSGTAKPSKRLRSSLSGERPKTTKAGRGDDAPASTRSLRSTINGSPRDKAIDASDDAEDAVSGAESPVSEYAPGSRPKAASGQSKAQPASVEASAPAVGHQKRPHEPSGAGVKKLSKLETNILEKENKIKDILQSIKSDKRKIEAAQERFLQLQDRSQRLNRKLEDAETNANNVEQSMSSRIDAHLSALYATRQELADLGRSHDTERLSSILGEADNWRRYSTGPSEQERQGSTNEDQVQGVPVTTGELPNGVQHKQEPDTDSLGGTAIFEQLVSAEHTSEEGHDDDELRNAKPSIELQADRPHLSEPQVGDEVIVNNE
ncbi:hypothetical protein K461DRAFT_275607 [Myriangium duriaei CBS 260.36]|uniref:Uncharacterized protein n=1 Tax=Myriangium duriaei CBS 260.36 TaxID=1168546 RepID=A0A9P4MNS3_9PEZI|nr:hypothetical protein K461DRAFT_275607 [Myriangium duriaei CBS 260.36]